MQDAPNQELIENCSDLFDRRNTGKDSLFVKLSDINNPEARQSYAKQTQQLLTPIEIDMQKLKTDQASNFSPKKHKKLGYSVKKIGSPSVPTEMSLQEILSQDSAVFRKAIEEEISGSLDVDIKKSTLLKEQKKNDLFRVYDHVDDTEEDDNDQYSPKNLKKQIPSSNLFKDILRFRTTEKDFDWSGREDYY